MTEKLSLSSTNWLRY